MKQLQAAAITDLILFIESMNQDMTLRLVIVPHVGLTVEDVTAKEVPS